MDRQIFLFSMIDTYSAELIIRKLLEFDRQSEEEITMFINSPGGSVIQMLAIIDAMNIVKSPIRTVVVGIAASAASVIAMCGDKRFISKTGQFMLHQASGVSCGEVSDMKDKVAQAEKLQNMMFEIIANKSGKTKQFIEELIDRKDKYFDARESVSMGFIDSIIQDGEAQVLKFSEGINVEGYEIKSSKNPEIQLLREGKYSHPIYGEMIISSKHLELLKNNFDSNVRGFDLSIDYTHENETGESPAAFWIKSLEIKDNADGNGKGLFARGEFTPKGEKLVSEKEYKYSSADFVIDYVDQSGKHHPYVLRGGTLTNRPFIKNMNPIKLSEETKSIKKEKIVMTLEQLQSALKEQGVDVLAITTERDSLKSRISELESKISELNALPVEKEEEIKALKDQLQSANQKIVDSEKLTAFNDLVSQGKVVPAQKEQIMEAFNSAESIKSFYAKAPSVVNMKKIGDGHEDSEEFSKEEQALIDCGEYTKEQIIEGRSPAKKK